MSTGVRPLDVFTLGVRHLRSKQVDEALAAFTEATVADPGMCDAWLGRIAAGDRALATVEGAYQSRAQLGQALKTARMVPAELRASTPMALGLFGLAVPITSEMHLAMAYAVALAEAEPPRLAQAAEVVDKAARRTNAAPLDLDLLDYIRLGLNVLARRWPDVLTLDGRQQWRSADLPDGAGFAGLLNAGRLLARVWAMIGTGNPEEALRTIEAAAVDRGLPTEVHARLRLARGYALRVLGRRDEADKAFGELHAWVGDKFDVAAAIADPDKVVEVVTAASLATRTDEWDPQSGQSATDLDNADRERRREVVRAEAKAQLDRQIGMRGVKDQIEQLESSAIMDQRRAAMGIPIPPIADSYILSGAPGTGKTITARALAGVLFGLGVIANPEVVEVSRADLCDEYLGRTAQKTNAVIDRALGKLLFIDEVGSLRKKGYSDGDAYGSEAVTELLRRMENDRQAADPTKKLVVVIAGYDADVNWFLDMDDGLPRRFKTRIYFESYTPQELVAIADVIAEDLHAVYSTAAKELLLDRLQKLAAVNIEHQDYSGKPRMVRAIDKAGNAGFVRNLTEKAGRVRDRRLVRTNVDTTVPGVAVTIEAEDVDAAFRELCAAQGVHLDG